MEMNDYSKLTVVKLKDELKSRGLATTGLKAALVARLEESDADSTENLTEEADVQNEAELTEGATEPEQTATSDSEHAPEPFHNTDIPQVESVQVNREETVEAPSAEAKAEADVELVDAEAEITTEPAKEQQLDKLPASDELHTAPLQTTTPAPSSPNDVPPADQQKDKPDDAESEALSITQLKDSQALGTPVPEQESQPTNNVRAVDLSRPDTQVSMGSEEMVEDKQKRKRRSRSPPLSTQEVAIKKFKADDGSPKAKLQEEETAVIRTGDTQAETRSTAETEPSPAKPLPADARFKSLFANNAPVVPGNHYDGALDDRNIEPSLHPATPALYIRNLQRPLQPNNLRDHLTALSQPPGADLEDTIIEFHLDAIRSHCLVQFISISAASRVRLAFHDTIWPKERDRRPLWVDFVPEERIKEFIEIERNAARTKPPKRWEIVYEDLGDGIVANLQEVSATFQRGSVSQSGHSGTTKFLTAKLNVAKGDPGRGFKALDDLFKSTTAKPKLYFQPVSESKVNLRVELLAKGKGGGRSDEMRRFSFEDDIVVDKGPEWGFGGKGAERKGRGGYRGGLGGRGFRGDSWRGAS